MGIIKYFRSLKASVFHRIFEGAKKSVTEIEQIEAQIAINQQIINEAAAQKQAVMKEYL